MIAAIRVRCQFPSVAHLQSWLGHGGHFILIAWLWAATSAIVVAVDPPTMTHGPILGRPAARSMGVWARTSIPSRFEVRYGRSAGELTSSVTSEPTRWDDDCTGWVVLEGLEPSSTYYYQVFIDGYPQGQLSTFRTWPAADLVRNDEYNPRGLFNFKFEIGSCANQNPMHGIGHSLPTYQTMNREIADQVDFHIMNGDWLYEELRDYPPAAWLAANRLDDASAPRVVQVMPTIVGVWENYRLYLSRGVPLAQWHRRVPSFFTFDDHELVNDIWGAGSAGRRHRRTVFRDIGTQAWYDYLGWANPTAYPGQIHFGIAQLQAGSDLLVDPQADFTALPLDSMSNLHIHWGTPTAGLNDMVYDDDSGDPNSRVYDIVEVVDRHTLRLHMPAAATGESSYSIGRRNYGKISIANCEIYLLDTRSHRQMHDVRHPDKKGLTMLGLHQRDWLMQNMRDSTADFFFIVSSVPMMVPHSGAGGFEFDAANKEESWVAFLDEREMLVDFWDGLGKPVLVMTGDLHNSFAIKITDRVWEFCCGPHNSVNHVPALDEGDRPATGWYDSGPRRCDIRWSSYILPDIPRLDRCYPYYCVVQVNNVFNMPPRQGGTRWVAYPHPQVILQYFHGRTGELAYSETITVDHGDGDGNPPAAKVPAAESE
ncbi:MAG: metallophosphoesterase family protein [Planctomycetota bacterium]|nr:MAG: metallophosphoesterase family protein [Planctomycetota bacterium]